MKLRMSINLETEAPLLHELPGLKILESSSECEGYPDAVAAAATRLNRASAVSVPKTPSVQVAPSVVSRLRGYQVEAVQRLGSILRECGGAILADDMGCGKSRTAIALADTLGCKRVLVLCPGLARETWVGELEKWGDSNWALVLPKDDRRFDSECEKLPTARWVISSFDLVERAHALGFSKEMPTAVFIDEAHRIKGRKGKRASKVRELAAFVPFKLAITATPMANHPSEFYGILQTLVGRQRFGSGWQFDVAYGGGHQGAHGFELGEPSAARLRELRLRLGYYLIRREKKDVLGELPPLNRQVIWVDPSEAGRNALLQCRVDGMQGVQNALAATLEAKFDAAIELAHDAKRFLLYTSRREHCERLSRQIAYGGTGAVAITGEMSHEKRAAVLSECRKRQTGVVATIDAAGESLNLQGLASVGIMHCLDWNPYKMIQAEARIYRMGVTEPVTWYYLACRDTMDSIVIYNVVNKMSMAGAVLPSQESSDELRKTLDGHQNGAGFTEADAAAAIYAALQETDE